MPNQITFQGLVDIKQKETLTEYLILSRVFNNKMALRTSQQLTLVDGRGHSYNVRAVQLANQRMILTGTGWSQFVRTSVSLEADKICFRLRINGSYDVVIFDSAGEQRMLEENGGFESNKCLIQVSGETAHEEYVPVFFLHDLDVQYRRHTDRTATLFGPHQIADVEVIYEEEDDDVRNEDNVAAWRAVGFYGPKWTNLCFEHEVSMGVHIMLTNLGQGRFLFDYFNEEGIGLAAATEVAREIPVSVRPTLTEEYVTESEGEDMDSLRHSCQISGHQHNNGRPFFIKKLTEHSFTTKFLTVPSHFVRQHRLKTFKTAFVCVGSLRYAAKIDILYDARRVGDESHVILQTDWLKLSLKSGYVAGQELRFELCVVHGVSGPSIEFHVC